MIIPENPEYDIGITLNFNLLVNVGGKERTFQEFNHLFKNVGFLIKSTIRNKGIISFITAEKIKNII